MHTNTPSPFSVVILNVGYICNSLEYRSVLYINENYFCGEFRHMWSSCEWTFSTGVFNLMDLQYTSHIHVLVNCVMHHATYDLLSKSFNFCFHLLNSAHIGVIHIISEVIPNRITRWIHVEETYIVVRATHNWRGLEIDWTWHGYQTHNTGHPRWHCAHHPAREIFVSTFLPPSVTRMASFCSCCSYHLSCSAVLRKSSSKSLLADWTPYNKFCRAEQCLQDSIWTSKGSEPHVLFIHEPMTWK
jgi:hypothetical protein